MSESSNPEVHPSVDESGWAKASRWIGERVSGFAEFVGILIGIAVSVRRMVFAFGFACLAAGLGKSLMHAWHGPRWMFIGGILMGLAWPIKMDDRK